MKEDRKCFRLTLKTPEGCREIDVVDDQHILDAALASGIRLPYSCRVGWCLSCAARVEEGAFDQSDSRRYFEQDREAGFSLLCTASPRSDLVIQTHARREMRRNRNRFGLPYPKGSWGEPA